MAETITNVLQISMQDSDNNSYSFNIENPNEGVTIQQVNAALEPLINTQKWYSTKDRPIVRVRNATLTRTRKIVLEDSTEITVTPAEINITSSSTQATATLTVTGEAIQGYKFSGQKLVLQSANIDTVNNTLELNLINNSPNSTLQDTINIVTTTQILTVPISFTRNG